MNAKEYLSQAMWLDKMIDTKIRHKESLEALAERVSVDFSREKVSGGTGSISPMEDAVVKLIDLSYEINDDIDKLVDLKREILETISLVEDYRYRSVLEMRYINGLKWDDIVKYSGYDRRYLLKLHGKALIEIEKIIKEDTKRH